jgi:hypothetical protein
MNKLPDSQQRKRCLVAMILTLPFGNSVLGQEQVSSSITQGPAGGVTLTWPTAPGRIYEIHTRDGLEAPWITTNLAPVRAQSSRAAASDLFGDPPHSVRFYEVLAQPGPPGNTSPITTNTVVELEKVLGLTFTPTQGSQLTTNLVLNRTVFESMRQTRLDNSARLPLLFDVLPAGFSLPTSQAAITWSPPQVLSPSTNHAEIAFYSVRDLGELIRTRQISSTDLTRIYLDRLKKYDPTLHCVGKGSVPHNTLLTLIWR